MKRPSCPVLRALAMASAAMFGALPAEARMLNFDQAHAPDQLIVKFKPAVGVAAATNVIKAMGGKVEHAFRSSGALLVRWAPGVARIESLAATLDRRGDVEYVEANQILTLDATIPNDPEFGRLYGMDNGGTEGGVVDADIDAPEAWDQTTGSRDVLVGIIDTGVDYNHPDLADNYWHNPGETGLDANGADKATNGIDDDANGYVDDFRGWDFVNNDNDPLDDHAHGTHCAGTIGASGNDGLGVVGVNWQVSIVGLKFLSAAGSGTLADAVRAIEYATLIGVTMTSNSWGGGGYSDVMDAAIRAAGDAGILFIAASGNAGGNNDLAPHYPSSYGADNIVAVAATDRRDQIALFSNYGLTSVDVGAPGVDILSTVLAGGYDTFSGTSMATPHVSGVAALIKAAFPAATAAEIKARLINTADPVAGLAGRTLTGGRVNAASALEIDTVAPNRVTGLAVVGAGITSVDLTWRQAGDDGASGSARRYDLRYAPLPIADERAWAAATPAASVAGGTPTIVATLGGLPLNFSGYVAMKAIDNVGNVGPLSASVPFVLRAIREIASHRAESMAGVTADVPWGLQAATAGNAFSDSPAGPYANSVNLALTLDEVAVDDGHLMLTLKMTHDLESGYDFGYVELSKDGGATWAQVDRVTGVAPWTTKSYDLSAVATGATSVRLRFRITSDSSVVREGWQLDDVVLFGAVP